MKYQGKLIEVVGTVYGTIYVGKVFETEEEAVHPSGRMRNHCRRIDFEDFGSVYVKDFLCDAGDLMWQMDSNSNTWCEHAEGGGAWFGYRTPKNWAEVYARCTYSGRIEELDEPYEIYW
ncbi:MAG: hypothetical protein GX892_07070 [Thermoanaerobacteraceae bacterium]|nr:hypothetical protein [Thermoanaerobacteraceae bacterium]